MADLKDMTQEELIKELDKLRQDRDSWKSAWVYQHVLSGKMYWDGAAWGYTMGLSKDSSYSLPGTKSDVARGISILIEDRRTAHLDVGLEVADDDALEAILLPMTFYVSQYSTGDQVLFQYIDGKRKVVRVKTHDGYICEADGKPIKDPKVDILGHRFK